MNLSNRTINKNLQIEHITADEHVVSYSFSMYFYYKLIAKRNSECKGNCSNCFIREPFDHSDNKFMLIIKQIYKKVK